MAKFKLYYLYVAYEVGMFFIEMKKRKASSIKLEFQENVGKFIVYIDDSAFKTIDGKLGWQIIKTLYSAASKKAKSTFDKDKNFDSEQDITSEELKESFHLKLLPLTKGRCLSYSYSKKQGGVYEACIKVKSDNLTDFISENIEELNNKISNEEKLFFDYNEKEIMEVENVLIRSDKIKLYLVDSEDRDHSFSVNIKEFEAKSDVKKFFARVKAKEEKIEEVVEEPSEEPKKDIKVSWDDEDKPKENVKISWDDEK